ncbi:hypothetical protein [Halarcobacter anaerophilus]|uniref:Uncharacterized protein n=1 Tax=Halarcobacter anaerophilus TaxID=877500 RepID=A0A4Q0Y0S9_9BACT|nr:hypothetical protein [Halarcobacter anaerophilus]QDF29002.1 hypothetical protein AANAER_1522 [Halarcobacter anaerophilus]RXJ63637.1 hypothetical protein CRV06_05435 [Halarcobacter anaerophilus]
MTLEHLNKNYIYKTDKEQYGVPEYWEEMKPDSKGKFIGDCCKGHDKSCSTSKFFKCLKSKLGWFHASYITAGGAIGCWVKYTKKIFKRI